MTLEKPQNIFLLIALLYGLVTVFVNPPFQANDEFCHFMRSYHVFEGKIISRVEGNCVGDELPESFADPRWMPYHVIPFNLEGRLGREAFWAAMEIRTEPAKRAFTEFYTHGRYPPSQYVGQALGITLGRLLFDTLLPLAYAARVGNLLVWIALLYAAIAVIPRGKWILLAIGLAPVSLYQAASLNGDAMLNALSCLIPALALKLAMNPEDGHVPFRAVLLSGLLIALAGIAKLAYLPLAGLWFLIPACRFGSLRRYLACTGCVLIPALLLWAVWLHLSMGLVIPYEQYNVVSRDSQSILPGLNPRVHIAQAVGHPLEFACMLARALPIVLTSFATWFGWDMTLPSGSGWLLAGLLLASVLFADADAPRLAWQQRMVLLGVGCAGLGMIALFLYAGWTPLGMTRINGFHGRYILPLMPAVLLGVSIEGGGRRARLWQAGLLGAVLISGPLLWVTIWLRFYG